MSKKKGRSTFYRKAIGSKIVLRDLRAKKTSNEAQNNGGGEGGSDGVGIILSTRLQAKCIEERKKRTVKTNSDRERREETGTREREDWSTRWSAPRVDAARILIRDGEKGRKKRSLVGLGRKGGIDKGREPKQRKKKTR